MQPEPSRLPILCISDCRYDLVYSRDDGCWRVFGNAVITGLNDDLFAFVDKRASSACKWCVQIS